jgi:hypothetical protein
MALDKSGRPIPVFTPPRGDPPPPTPPDHVSPRKDTLEADVALLKADVSNLRREFQILREMMGHTLQERIERVDPVPPA